MHLARVKASAIKFLTVALIDYDGNGAPYCRSNNDSSLKVRLTATMSDRCGFIIMDGLYGIPGATHVHHATTYKKQSRHGRRQF